ncbi:MAG: 50S ribosomal protein L11 [Candidatus Taylorbacteria bacterium]
MAKKITKKLKLIIPAGKANPAPPIGPTLGQAKVNIGEFVTRFNEGTKSMMGDLVPVEVTVFEDKTFTLTFKTPPATDLILKAIGKEKGSGKNAVEKVGTLSRAQVKMIAEKKLKDLNANDVEAAMKIIEGSARSMGVDVK